MANAGPIPMKPFLVMASAMALVSVSAFIRAFTSDGRRGSGSESSEAYDDSGRWLDFWTGLDQAQEEGENAGPGSVGFLQGGLHAPDNGDWGAEGDVENALGELLGTEIVQNDFGYGTISLGTTYGHGGWSSSSNYWWNRYNWLRRYFKKYYKKHASGWKRQWLVPDGSGSAYVSMPSTFGLLDAGGNGWTWHVDDLDDAVPASQPVTTDSTVNVVFVSSRVGAKTGAAAYIRSFERSSGNEVFSQSLPHPNSSVSVTEDDGEIAVETCYGPGGACDVHRYSI